MWKLIFISFICVSFFCCYIDMFKVLQICFHLFEPLCCYFVMLKFCSKFCTFIFSCLCVIFHLYIVPIRYIPPNFLFDLLLFICQVPLLRSLDLLLLCWFCYNKESIFIGYFTQSLIGNIAPFWLFKDHLLHCFSTFFHINNDLILVTLEKTFPMANCKFNLKVIWLLFYGF